MTIEPTTRCAMTGEELKTQREAMGLTQQELASLLRTSKASVQRMEAGKSSAADLDDAVRALLDRDTAPRMLLEAVKRIYPGYEPVLVSFDPRLTTPGVRVMVHFKGNDTLGFITLTEQFEEERGWFLELVEAPPGRPHFNVTYNPQQASPLLFGDVILRAVGALRSGKIDLGTFVIEAARAGRSKEGEACFEASTFQPTLEAIGLKGNWASMTDWLDDGREWPEGWSVDLTYERWRFSGIVETHPEDQDKVSAST